MATVGRYELFGLLGAGGMATVHFGRLAGPGGFSRIVAIKRLHAGLARNPEHTAMLLDEARLASRVRHPNAGSVLDVFEDGGEVFLVMEYVEGETLARVAGEPIPLDIAAAITCDVLEGLHAAHEARGAAGEELGLVHRDVSPQNILVGTDGLAHLLDFGIAKATGRLHVTRDGGVKGKVGYMAPEHLRGEPLTRAADLYSTAAVLWEMLAGRRLFDGEHDAAVVVACLNGQIEPPSKVAHGLPLAVDEVVMRGLARRANARFPTARAMADAIRAATTVAPPAAVTAWIEMRASEALRARRAAFRAIEAEPAAKPPADPAIASAALPSAIAPSGDPGLGSSPRARARRRAIAVGVGVLAFTAVVGGTAAAWRGFAHGTASPRAVDAQVSTGSIPMAPSAPVATSLEEGSGVPDAPSALLLPGTGLPVPGASQAASSRTPRTRPLLSPKRDCDPPYALEGRRRVIKPGCL